MLEGMSSNLHTGPPPHIWRSPPPAPSPHQLKLAPSRLPNCLMPHCPSWHRVSTSIETEASLTELLPSAVVIAHQSHQLIMQFDYWLRLPSSVVDYITCAINKWGSHNRHSMDFLASASKVVRLSQTKGIAFISRAVALSYTVKRRSHSERQVNGVSYNHPQIAVPYISFINSPKFLWSRDCCFQWAVRISLLHSIWFHAIKSFWLFQGSSSFTVISRPKVQLFGCHQTQHTSRQVWLRLLYNCIVDQFVSTGEFLAFAYFNPLSTCFLQLLKLPQVPLCILSTKTLISPFTELQTSSNFKLLFIPKDIFSRGIFLIAETTPWSTLRLNLNRCLWLLPPKLLCTKSIVLINRYCKSTNEWISTPLFRSSSLDNKTRSCSEFLQVFRIRYATIGLIIFSDTLVFWSSWWLKLLIWLTFQFLHSSVSKSSGELQDSLASANTWFCWLLTATWVGLHSAFQTSQISSSDTAAEISVPLLTEFCVLTSKTNPVSPRRSSMS